MLERFASYNRLSSSSMELISVIVRIQNEIKQLAKDQSEDSVRRIASLADELDICMDAYKSHLIDSVKDLSGTSDGDEDEIITGICDNDGVKIS